ncbi:MAG TPA: DnaJ domain-containing protein [Candidatus Binatia bacterium]|nr:DnaJ domain-containing protein [Candidatus Binatia bacterium]
MTTKDYYLILGVSREENACGIHHAFRELAKRYHPDRAGPEGASKFQDLQEAYAVLSTPEQKTLYDNELQQDESSPRSRAEPIFSRPRSRPEPLIPEPISLLRDFQTIRPSFDALFERFIRNFTGDDVPKGERLQSLNVEVMLSPEEAARGLTVPVGVPVFYTCPHCDGSGRVWLFPCVDCRGQGMIEDEEAVRVRIPAMSADQTVMELPIHGLGIHNFYLRLHIRLSR